MGLIGEFSRISFFINRRQSTCGGIGDLEVASGGGRGRDSGWNQEHKQLLGMKGRWPWNLLSLEAQFAFDLSSLSSSLRVNKGGFNCKERAINLITGCQRRNGFCEEHQMQKSFEVAGALIFMRFSSLRFSSPRFCRSLSSWDSFTSSSSLPGCLPAFLPRVNYFIILRVTFVSVLIKGQMTWKGGASWVFNRVDNRLEELLELF